VLLAAEEVVGDGQQLDKVVQAAVELVVTMVETPVLEHKEIQVVEETYPKRVDKDMVQAPEEVADVTLQEIQDKMMVVDQVVMVVHILHMVVQQDSAPVAAEVVPDTTMFLRDMVEIMVVVEDVLEIMVEQLVGKHKMVAVAKVEVPVAVLMVLGEVLLEQQMAVVEKLLLGGRNKNKSKNIIWDILQK
jgi:hypothetical protein